MSEAVVSLSFYPRELEGSVQVAEGRVVEAEQKARTLQTALQTTQSELINLRNKYDEEAHAK